MFLEDVALVRAQALFALCCFLAQASSGGTSDSYTRGKAELDAQQFAAAEADLAEAERAAPGATNALALRAKALLHLQRFDEAETCLRDYLKSKPGSADATYLLAYTLFRRDRPAESLATYTQAARIQRPKPDDLKVVGLDYVLLNDYPDALKWLQQSVAEGPGDPEAIYYLGRAYYVENSFDKAIAQFTLCLQLDPSSVRAENGLGLAYAAKNQPDLAEAAYRKAIAASSQTQLRSAEPYVNLADLLSRSNANGSNHNDEALALLTIAEQIGGEPAKVAEIRGRIFYSQDKLADAETALRAAIAAEPKNGSLHFLLGRVLKREGKTADAEAEFQRTQALLDTRSSGQN